MNIIYLSDLSGMGGGEVSLLHIMQEMAKYHKVYLLCRVPGTLADRAAAYGFKVFCYDYKKNLVKAIINFHQIIKKYNIEVVHSNELTTSIWQGIQLSVMNQKRIINVCTCHGQWYELSFLKKVLIRKYISHIFCVSKVVESNLNRQLIMNTSVSYLGVPEEKFKIDRKSTENIRKELGIENHNTVVITVGRYQKIKGQLKGVKAIEKISKSKPEIIYFLIGDNIYNSKADEEYKKAVVDYIETSKLHEHVKLLGERNDVPQLMAISDYVMITSDNESFGMVAIEAIAAGRILVTTPCSGVCEILENDKNMIAKTNDDQGLFEVLSGVINNEQVHKDSLEKIKLLQNKFSVNEVCIKYVSQYSK